MMAFFFTTLTTACLAAAFTLLAFRLAGHRKQVCLDKEYFAAAIANHNAMVGRKHQVPT
jgi:hypothetical protein